MKVMAAVMAFVAGEAMNVHQVCDEAGISRQTFYKYVARCRAEGAGRVRAAVAPAADEPAGGGVDVEEAVIGWRKQLEDGRARSWGDDDPVAPRPRRDGSRRRCRRRRRSIGSWCGAGSSTAQPQKRPKSSWRRFEAPAPNEWWQIDSTDWVIATGGLVKIFNIVDDHSRVGCESRAVTEATGEEAWTTFCAAAQEWGLPAGDAVGQRAVLLRQAPRLRGAVRSPAPRRRGPPDDRAALPPADHRQGRTVPADAQEVAAPPRPPSRPGP